MNSRYSIVHHECGKVHHLPHATNVLDAYSEAKKTAWYRGKWYLIYNPTHSVTTSFYL